MTWCVCGRESSADPWDLVEAGFQDCDAAVDWLKENYRSAQCSGLVEFYIDLEANENYADLYANVRDGELSFELASGQPARREGD